MISRSTGTRLVVPVSDAMVPHRSCSIIFHFQFHCSTPQVSLSPYQINDAIICCNTVFRFYFHTFDCIVPASSQLIHFQMAAVLEYNLSLSTLFGHILSHSPHSIPFCHPQFCHLCRAETLRHPAVQSKLNDVTVHLSDTISHRYVVAPAHFQLTSTMPCHSL